MKPKQIKLIKSLYKSADYEQKEKIKECFPEVFEETLPDIGWVRRNNMTAIVYRTGNASGYGLIGGSWLNNDKWSFCYFSEYWQPATEEEVKEMLIAEAKRRGVWDCEIKNHANGTRFSGYVSFDEEFAFKSNKLFSKYGLIFDNGEWATPIEEDKPNPVTFTIDGKTYLVTLIDENDLPV
jgi:hypothetical protein